MRQWMALSLGLAVLMAGCSATPRQGQVSRDELSYYAIELPSLTASAPSDRRAARRLRDAPQPSPALIRQALLAEHRRWVGTPYVLGGDSRRGIDCSALVQRVYQEAFLYELPRTTEAQQYEGRRIGRDELAPGDLIFFHSPGRYRHVGIYVGQGLFLHASTSQGVKLSRLDNAYWSRNYRQARRPMERTELAQRAVLAHEG
ncbi:bifunctional murein DD-endopeptidase/murein LD-carboxypeptidase [Halomonas shantousis]